MNLEILAPAGNEECMKAAVRCGANAVYLGSKSINARRNADNFDNEQLKAAVEYCHQRNVKVYLTANTLVSDSEMKEAYETIKAAFLCGTDGFIVQDLGLAKMIKKCFPDAKLHASTQCSVMTADGINELKQLGFSRAVIPREMSIEEIKDLRKRTDIELEMFVHGALCMCVSGQCYMSSMLGSRSGNRGLCAQPCRLSFSADNSGSCDLSLKDLSLIRHIKEIKDAGIISLKIEGRMKRPEYVAAAVTACKKAIDSQYTDDDENILRSVFSRSGFTDGYFTGIRKNMFGTRQKEDVVAAESVLKELSHLYEKENNLIGIDLFFECKYNKPLKLTAKTDRKEVTVSSTAPEKAINKPLTEKILQSRLSKFGNTQYYAGNIQIELDDGLTAPVSEINALRRAVVEKLDTLKIDDVKVNKFNEIKSKSKNSKPYFTARFSDAAAIPKNHPFKRIFIPIWCDDNDFAAYNAGVEIPRGLFSMEEKLKERLAHLKSIGVKNALCSNLGAYKTAQDIGFTVFGDFGLNIFNSESARMFNSPILSFELNLNQTNAINAEDTGIIGYGKLPLMITRNCPVKNRIGCENCKKQGTLIDRKGYKFPVKCSSYPCVEIFNPIPIYLADKADKIKTDFIHFYFTDESIDDVEKIIDSYNKRLECSGEFTRGLYFRGVK